MKILPPTFVLGSVAEDEDESGSGYEITDFVLDASTVRGPIYQLKDLVATARANVAARQGGPVERSAYASFLHWMALCATVRGAEPARLATLIAQAEIELERAANGYFPNSARIQNWYLNRQNGEVDEFRQKIIDLVPRRSVGSSGAVAPNKRLPARSTRPGLSPLDEDGGTAS